MSKMSYKMSIYLVALSVVPIAFVQASESMTVAENPTQFGKGAATSCLEDSELGRVLLVLNESPNELADRKLHSISLRIEKNGRPASVKVLDPQKRGVKDLESQIQRVCQSSKSVAQQRKINFVFIDQAKAVKTFRSRRAPDE